MKYNILIVDDEKGIRDSLKEYFELKYENTQIETSTDADDAFTKTSEKPYHLILLDIVMPGMNAFEFLKKVKEKNQLVQVLMITGNSTKDKVLNALENGADDYLTKPFEFKDLDKIVNCTIQKIERWKSVFQKSL